MIIAEIFKLNKYTKWYFAIISQPLQVKYTEKHHIIPKCCGGADIDSNIVRLSARQHFVCHLLLTKMAILPLHHGKLCYALKCMLIQRSKDGHRYIPKNSKIFEMARKSHKGIPKSESHRANLSKAKKGVKLGPPSKETKAKQSAWQKGKLKHCSPETLAKKRKALLGKDTWMKGRKHSAESLLKMSESQKNRVRKASTKHSVIAIENNRRAQQKYIYTLISPLGEIFKTSDMKTFCASMGLPYGRLVNKKHLGKSIKDNKRLKNKSNVGWVTKSAELLV